jgi:hypothetical protein
VVEAAAAVAEAEAHNQMEEEDHLKAHYHSQFQMERVFPV